MARKIMDTSLQLNLGIFGIWFCHITPYFEGVSPQIISNLWNLAPTDLTYVYNWIQPFWRGPESCLKKCSLGNLAKQQGGGWWLQWVHRHIWCPGYVRIFQGRRSRNIFLITMSCIWDGSPQTWIVSYFLSIWPFNPQAFKFSTLDPSAHVSPG